MKCPFWISWVYVYSMRVCRSAACAVYNTVTLRWGNVGHSLLTYLLLFGHEYYQTLPAAPLFRLLLHCRYCISFLCQDKDHWLLQRNCHVFCQIALLVCLLCYFRHIYFLKCTCAKSVKKEELFHLIWHQFIRMLPVKCKSRVTYFPD